MAVQAHIGLFDIGATNLDGLTISTMEMYQSGCWQGINVDIHLLKSRNSAAVRKPMTDVKGMIREQRLISRMRFMIRLALSLKSTLRMSMISGLDDPGEGRQIAVKVTIVPVA